MNSNNWIANKSQSQQQKRFRLTAGSEVKAKNVKDSSVTLRGYWGENIVSTFWPLTSGTQRSANTEWPENASEVVAPMAMAGN